MWLLVDDLREIKADHVARTAADATRMLNKNEYDGAYFDHDLASYDEAGREITGYHVMLEALHNNRLPKKIILVTANPVGRKKMEDLLRFFEYTKKSPTEFVNI